VSRKRKQTAGPTDQTMARGDHLERRATTTPNKQLTHHSAAGTRKNN